MPSTLGVTFLLASILGSIAFVQSMPDHEFQRYARPLQQFRDMLGNRWPEADAFSTAVHANKGAAPQSQAHSATEECLRIAGAFAVELDHKSQVPQLAATEPARKVCQWFQERVGSEADLLTLTKAPEQIHIAPTDIDGNVSVVWTTSTASNHSQVCWWPELPGNASTQCVAGTSWTYHPISVIPWVGMLHGGFMTGLIPGTRYCYIVGDPALRSYSAETCFAAPDLHKDELLLALGGDMGTYQVLGHLVAAQMRADEVAHRLHFDAFWLLGDIAYSTLDPPHWNFEFFWDMFLNQEQSLANHVPMLVTYGNHDFAGGDSGAYLNRFRNPTTGDSGSKYYWAYDHGPVRYVSMCTEVGLNPVLCNYAPGSPQYEWLETQFATVNRTKTPWLVLAGHRPMYSSDKATDSGPLQRFIEPLILKYRVDVEMSGHMHESELVAPVANDTALLDGVSQLGNNSWRFDRPKAPVHMTLGILGALINEHYVHPQPQWSLFRQGELFSDSYGYAQARVNRDWFNVTVLLQKDNSTMWSVEIRR